jgi:uncharacterized membrane-anchored protein YjiN (DUF445 family)
MENDIWEFSNSILAPPMDPKDLIIHELKDIKGRRNNLDRVKDHLIPHLSRKTIVRDMWEALKCLFQRKKENHKIVLREKIMDINMIVSYMVKTYLTQI